MNDQPADETAAREDPFCCGCGRVKQLGAVVCWSCFKHRIDVTPLKYFEGSLTEWLAQIGRLH